MENELPKINWIKNPHYEEPWFEDGSKYLVALRVHHGKTNTTNWEFDVVFTDCDGEEMYLNNSQGEPYDSWSWDDFEYIHVIEGKMPTDRIKE